MIFFAERIIARQSHRETLFSQEFVKEIGHFISYRAENKLFNKGLSRLVYIFHLGLFHLEGYGGG